MKTATVRPYPDPTTGQWVGEHETHDASGEVRRDTAWFDSRDAASLFACTGLIVTTWADGYGRWHADVKIPPVPFTGDAETGRTLARAGRAARANILAELAERGPVDPSVVRIKRTGVSQDARTVHYREA